MSRCIVARKLGAGMVATRRRRAEVERLRKSHVLTTVRSIAGKLSDERAVIGRVGGGARQRDRFRLQTDRARFASDAAGAQTRFRQAVDVARTVLLVFRLGGSMA